MYILVNPNWFQEGRNGVLQFSNSVNSDARLQESSGFNEYVVCRDKLMLFSDQSLPYACCERMTYVFAI